MYLFYLLRGEGTLAVEGTADCCDCISAAKVGAGDAGFITMVGFCCIKLKIGSDEHVGPPLCALGFTAELLSGVDIACGMPGVLGGLWSIPAKWM